MFENYILKNRKEIIESVCDLITYPSISIETHNPNAPFGTACSDVLKHFLNLASNLGFQTKNVDDYCGYVEFGEGDELIGIVGHLDVVPANENDWSYSPFVPTIVDNKIYGRGAIDDKGPVIASLYAMKAVMNYMNENNLSFNKRVRLIVGLNEEKDWKCIDYYKTHEDIPTLGFSPDADFPCIYAEKSVISLKISDDISNIYSQNKKIQKSPIIIEDFDCDDNAINVVPKFCSVILSISEEITSNNFINTCKSIIQKYKYEIDLYKIDDYHIKLSSYGIASHSAHPENGNNAITKLIITLNDIFNTYKLNIPLFDNFVKKISDDYTGKLLNINVFDESGPLTLTTSQIFIKENQINISLNLRVPVNTKPSYIIDVFKNNFNEKIEVLNVLDSLYIKKENVLVQKLCNIFNETCSTNYEPIAIGGATYARAFPNCISFGMNFPGDKDMCHQINEFVEIDKLVLSTNIYAKAIYELIK